jgi:hypothetical protein
MNPFSRLLLALCLAAAPAAAQDSTAGTATLQDGGQVILMRRKPRLANSCG